MMHQWFIVVENQIYLREFSGAFGINAIKCALKSWGMASSLIESGRNLESHYLKIGA